MIRFRHKGDFEKTAKFLTRAQKRTYLDHLKEYGARGVEALSAATPVDSGKTASSWDYTITQGNGYVEICWSNSNVNKGVNIAVILQYGHGTRHGGYVEGIDYINPAMRPIFEAIADEAWKGVVSS